MDSVTLVLTRTPKDEFVMIGGDLMDDVDDLSDEDRRKLYVSRRAAPDAKPAIKHSSGRWGTLAMIRGPKVHAARFTHLVVANLPMIGAFLVPLDQAPGVLGTLVNTAVVAAKGHALQQLRFAGRVLELETDPGSISAVTEFTTIERYRSNLGALGADGYVTMPAHEEPYGLRVERGNRVVKTLRAGHSGDCIRVLGGRTKAQRGILIHEAPQVGWVIGCIAPRPKNNRSVFENRDGNPSDLSVRKIIQEMMAFGNGKGQLYVLP